jgi:competence protein ComFC
MANLRYLAYRWFWKSIDWLYPPECGGCGKRGLRWCDECEKKVREINAPLCLRCGVALPAYFSSSEQICIPCRTQPPHYEALRSRGIFESSLRAAIHALKYKGNLGLGEMLAAGLGRTLRRFNWMVDGIIPVPLSRARLRERGYNQAALLAQPLALAEEIPYLPKAVERVRDTASQVGLKIDERRRNVAGAFQARRSEIDGKTILLVDDVATTGATLDACAEALLRGGAGLVYGLTLARAQFNP